jgi:hypothetical protein
MGRYTLDTYWRYVGHHTDGNLSEEMAAISDIWQVEQIMWNLVMNLTGKQGYDMEPFTHKVSEDSDSLEIVLNDGYSYGIDRYKNHVFSGEIPFEASGMNSDTLKNTITMCMDYRQRKRWSFAQLKCVTKG